MGIVADTPKALQVVNARSTAMEYFSEETVNLVKNTICRGATGEELALFLHQCKRTGLDPFSRQIHAVKRWDRELGREVMSIQVGIDGFRLIADRTGAYAGNDDPVYDAEDKPYPNKATVTVWKLVNGQRVPFTRSARWSEFVQTKKDGTVTKFWKQMPYLMLGKVAEALALRAAFPQELSGLYTPEEMMQAEVEQPPPRQVEAPPAPAKPKEPAKPKAMTADQYAEQMRRASTLEKLSAAWECVPASMRPTLVSVKDEMKRQLAGEQEVAHQ